MNSLRKVMTSAALLLASFVSLTTLAANNCVWLGLASPADGKWSNAANWKDGLVPTAGDTVALTPTGRVDGVINNDISGLTIASLTYYGDVSYALTGNALVVNSGIDFRGTGGVQTNDVAISFTGQFIINFYGASRSVFTKKISTGAYTNTGTFYVRNRDDWHTGTLTFDCDLSIHSMCLHLAGHKKTNDPITFNGAVDSYYFYGDDGSSGDCFGPVILNGSVKIGGGGIRVGTSRYQIGDNCVFDAGNLLYFTYYSESDPYQGLFDLNGHDVTCKALISNQYRPSTVQSTAPATLTIKATADNTFHNRIQGAVSLDFNPTDAKTLTLTSDDTTRASTMSGSITVSSGTVKVTGKRTLKNVPSVRVASGATFAVDAAANPFSDTLVIQTAEDGFITLTNCAMTVAALRVGDTLVPAGTYTGDATAANYLPQLTGPCELTVAGTSVAATWTGAAGDGLWTSAKNWNIGIVPTAGDTVTLTGDGLKAVGGVITADAGRTVSSVTVSGSTPFALAGALNLTAATPLTLAQTCVFTNNATLAFGAAESTISLTANGTFRQYGAIAGVGTKLTYASGSKTPTLSLGGTSTYTGDTVFSGSVNSIATASGQAFGAGGTVDITGRNLNFGAGGTYPTNFRMTDKRNLYFRAPAATTFELSGNIIASNGLLLAAGDGNGRKAHRINFRGDIDCGNATLEIQLYESVQPHYYGAVTAKTVSGGCSWANVNSYQHLDATGGAAGVKTWNFGYSTSAIAAVDDPFGATAGALPVLMFGAYYAEAVTGSATGILDPRGHTVTADRVSHANTRLNCGYISNGSGHGRLVLRGTADATSYAACAGNMDIVWNPTNNYVQTFAGRASTMKGSLIVLNGTLAITDTASFKNVTNLTVAANAGFSLGSALGLTTGGMTLILEPDAKLDFPDGTYSFAAIYRDGKRLMGDLTQEEIPEIMSSGVTFTAPIVTSEATWSPAAETPDDSLATAANWKGGETPDLTQASTIAIFGEGGAKAETPAGGVYLNGARFEGVATNFAIAGEGAFRVREAGITVAAKHKTTIKAPVDLVFAQTWNVDAGATLSVSNVVSPSRSTLTKTGSGALSLNGEMGDVSTFRGENGEIYVNAATNAFGTASDDVTVTIWERKATGCNGIVYFTKSTVVERPFNFYHSSQMGRPGIRVSENAVVRFTKPVSFNPGSYTDGSFAIFSNAALVFEQGVAFRYIDIFGSGSRTNPGRIVVNGGSFTLASSFQLRDSTRVELNASHLNTTQPIVFSTGAYSSLSAGSLVFGADYALDNEKTGFDITAAKWSGFIDLGGHDQRIGVLNVGSAVTGYLTSASPAQVHVIRASDKTIAASNFFRDAAGIDKEGTAKMTINAPMTSTGALTVSAGTLAFGANGAWGNASSVTIASGATLDLAEGVRLHAASFSVGGEACEGGYWGSLDCTDARVPAAHKIAAITGAGVLKVRGTGLIYYVK